MLGTVAEGGACIATTCLTRPRPSVQTGAYFELPAVPPRYLSPPERLQSSARQRIALLLNAARPEEIVLGPSTTVLCQFLARAMEGRLKPGDEIVVTDFDHESNIGPWRRLEERGIVIKTWSLDPETLTIDLDALDALMSERTRLVAVTHASNILGTIHPVAEIARRRACTRGAEIVVDAVAYAPHRAVDVQAWDVDYYVFSFYKTYGPHFAVLYGKYDKLAELDGLYHYFYGRDKVPAKLEPGNTNYELAWGSAGIVDYSRHCSVAAPATVPPSYPRVRRYRGPRGHPCRAPARLPAATRNDVRIVGQRTSDAAVRVPTIAFKVEGKASDAVVRETDKDALGIRFGRLPFA